jgi:hypothetical protein
MDPILEITTIVTRHAKTSYPLIGIKLIRKRRERSYLFGLYPRKIRILVLSYENPSLFQELYKDSYRSRVDINLSKALK